MTDKERNVFEKNLQKDSFTSEASEGFESIDPSIAKNDLLTLRKRLKNRISGKPRIIWYSIAASVAVLMILSSIFIIIEKKRPYEQISYSPAPPSLKDIPVTKSQERTPETVEIKEQVPAIPERSKKVPAETQKSESKSGKRDEYKKEEITADQQVAIMVAEVEEPEKAIAGEKAMAAKPVQAKRTSGTYSQIKGRIISSEDNQPIPGVNITVKGTKKGTVTDTGGNFSLVAEEARNRMLVANFVGMVSKEFKAVEDTSMEIKLEPSLAALNEIVVVGYGTNGADFKREDALTGYIPPRPVNGQADFDKYIQDNIRRPDSASTGQRVVVVLNFVVDAKGKIDSIKVIRSPGKIFSNEAVRLVKEGPEWKPAEENGKVINDQVRIRIVFK